MKYIFSNHSLQQLEIRSISIEIVHLVIMQPDEIIEENNNQHIHQKIIEDYLYRVFISKTSKPAVIKTAYKTSKINKYGADES